jgi:MFS family permease
MDKKWWTLVAVCAGMFMLLLDVTIVIVAQPAIQAGLHASFSDVQWTLDAYALTLASLLLTSGSLADRYGRKLLFTIGLAVFTLGSLLCGLAASPLMLILSRCGQGIGGAMMFATSLALLGHSFRGRERGVAFGVWGAVVGIATALGPVLGGIITTEWDWRGIFLVNVPIGVFALAVTIWRTEESRSQDPGRPDWAGFALLTAGLVSLVYGLIRAGESSWSNAGVIALLAAGVVLLAAFGVTESRVAHPMFDLSLLRVPTFSLAQLVTSVIAGRLSSRVPTRWLIGPGLLLVGIGLIVMSGLNGDSAWTHLVPGFIIAGLGGGLVIPPLASTAIGVVPPAKAGMASGVNSTFRQVGIATGIAALGSIFTSAIGSHLTGALPPSLAGQAGSMVNAIRQGSIGQVIAGVPGADRAAVGLALRSSFATALNELLYVTAAVAIVGAVLAATLIRSKDFHRPGDAGPTAAAAGRAPAQEAA